MNFSTRGVDTTEKSGSKYLAYGINKAKIVGIEVQKSQKSESVKIEISLEGEPIKDAKFEGVNGGRGKVGKMYTFWLTKDKDYQSFLRQIGIIADKLGVRSQVDEISVDGIGDFEPFMKQVTPLLTGKFLWWNIGAEYWDEHKYRLQMLKYAFVKAPSEVDESTIVRDKGIVTSISLTSGEPGLIFDVKNKYHLKTFEKPSTDGVAGSASSFAATGSGNAINTLFDIPKEPVNDLPF
jgi:hypothetical protein